MQYGMGGNSGGQLSGFSEILGWIWVKPGWVDYPMRIPEMLLWKQVIPRCK